MMDGTWQQMNRHDLVHYNNLAVAVVTLLIFNVAGVPRLSQVCIHGAHSPL